MHAKCYWLLLSVVVTFCEVQLIEPAAAAERNGPESFVLFEGQSRETVRNLHL